MEPDPLSQLRDIHFPDSGGFWPPAPGWWVLLLLVLIGVVAMILLIRRRQRRNRWLRIARKELDQLARTRTASPQWFTQLNTLLKQCARVRYPLERPEAMSGTQWVEFLLKTSPTDRLASRPIVEAMVSSSWQPAASAEPDHALAFARTWLGGQSC